MVERVRVDAGGSGMIVDSSLVITQVRATDG
jgi:hypothetical protein